jgi:hypothetical protein
MKAEGNIQIKDITLSNPTMTVKTVNYDWVENTVNIECLFNEGGLYNHSRTFIFNNEEGKELSIEDIYSFINNDETLKQFK